MKYKIILILACIQIFGFQGCAYSQNDEFIFVDNYIKILQKYDDQTELEKLKTVDKVLNNLNSGDQWLQESKRAMSTSFRLLRESKMASKDNQEIAKKKSRASLETLEHSLMYLVKGLYFQSSDTSAINHKLAREERVIFSKKFNDISKREIFQKNLPIKNFLEFLISFLTSEKIEDLRHASSFLDIRA